MSRERESREGVRVEKERVVKECEYRRMRVEMECD